MADKTDNFGWEMLCKINEKFIKTKYDMVICFTHWILIRRGFRCAGVGDDIAYPKSDELSELMPEGWNTEAPYKLRYVYRNQLYIFSGLIDGDDLVMNLSRPIDMRALVASVNTGEISQLQGLLEKAIPAYKDVRTRIEQELIEPLLKIEVSKEAETQTSAGLAQRVFRTVQEVELPTPSIPLVRNTNVGMADLNPLFGGGGMLFEPPGFGPRPPFIDPGLPRGSVPPGARFDPIRPFNPNWPRPPPSSSRSRNNHPDHDHLPPPGYDDMFM